MNRPETLKILSVLRAAYPAFYAKMSRREADGVVALWESRFQDDAYSLVSAAVAALIDADEKGFPPHIGAVKAYLRRITEPEGLSELEAWKEKFSTIYALDNDAKEGWRTGLVTTFVKEIPFDSFDGDYAVVVVGPPPMMKFTGLELMNHGVDAEKVWMSFERKMSCAVGKCGHCRIDEVYVCLDGPVFPYTVARDLVD